MSRKSLLIIASKSMLGRAITEKAVACKKYNVFEVSHEDYNLLCDNETCQMFYDLQPQLVINCAGYNGNIGFNLKYPADIYFKTVQMNLNILRACRTGVEKIVNLITSCAYPDLGKEVLVEEDFFKGAPNPTVECHGFAKRTILEYSRQLHKQHGLNSVSVILNNCFGPHDRTDLERSKVVGALVKKFVDAKTNNSPEVVCWGTGKPLREILFAEDAANGVLQVLEKYGDVYTPINYGHGNEVSIKDLSEIIAKLVGYAGRIVWDTSKADGQMRKLLCNNKMNEILGPQTFTPLEEALKKTIDWYYNGRKN